MTEDSITVEILRSIRDELRSLRAETSARLDGVNERQDRTNERLDRVVQEQIRHATAIVGLEGRVSELGQGMNAMARELHGLNERIDNVLTGPVGSTVRATSERVDRLEARMDRLEAREG